MEDFVAAKWTRCPSTGQEVGLFGVMDGHGGASCCAFLARELLDAVLAHARFATDLPAALVEAFEATDARFLQEGARRAAAEAVRASVAASAGAAADPPMEQAAAAAAAAADAPSPRSTPPPPGGGRGSSGFYYYNGARSPGSAVGGGLANGNIVTAASAPPGEDGSTAVVAVLRSDGLLAVANVGDSRAVLMRGGRAHTLSVDHKPNVREERLRIERAGGAVVWSGVWRVGAAGAVGGAASGGGGGGGGGGLLAVSRAFGDRPLKLGAGVVATPDVKVVRLGPEDRVLVLASDGLFDVMNAQEALLIADGEACASAAARRLAAAALERGTLDNVSAVVVKLAFGGEGGASAGGEGGGAGAAGAVDFGSATATAATAAAAAAAATAATTS
jgi:serine/threonine protein phosphatase PrpC